MDQPDAIPEHRKGLSKSLAIAALTGATAVALTLPTIAQAQPSPTPPPPAPPSGNTFMQGPPPPGAPVPPPPPPIRTRHRRRRRSERTTAATAGSQRTTSATAGSQRAACTAGGSQRAAAPPPPEPGRVDNTAGGLSFVVPAGWQVSDSTQLSYGQALLTKIAPEGGQPPNDTSVLLGRLDLKLFAGAETDNTKAAQRLASDMGEFFMPFPGTRVNQETVPLDAAGMPGVASYYEVKFTDTNKPTGQIWAGVVGEPVEPGTPRGQRTPARWFVVWLGTATNPVPKGEATTLANSIRPFAAAAVRRRWTRTHRRHRRIPTRHRRIPTRHRRTRTRSTAGSQRATAGPERTAAAAGRRGGRAGRTGCRAGDDASRLTAGTRRRAVGRTRRPNCQLTFQGPTRGGWALLTLTMKQLVPPNPRTPVDWQRWKLPSGATGPSQISAAAPRCPPRLTPGVRRSSEGDPAGHQTTDRHCNKCFHNLHPFPAVPVPVTGTSPSRGPNRVIPRLCVRDPLGIGFFPRN